MRLPPPIVALLLGTFAVTVPSSPARAAEEDTDLKAEVKALKAEVAELKAKEEGSWLNERRREEIKGLIHEVLSDAETRASLAEGGLTAGYKDKFYLASEDGNYRLNMSGQVQAQYIANFRQHSSGADTLPDDDHETGFRLRRMRVWLDGSVISPRVEYYIQLAGDRDSGALNIEQAKISFRLTDALKIGAGRFKTMFLHEEMVSDKYQLAVDRSLMNQIFTTDYVEGAWVEYFPTDWLHLSASVDDGQLSGNPGGSSSGFQNGAQDFNNDATDIAFTGRAELKLAGDWKQQNEFQAWSAQPTGIFLGAAAHYEVGETGDRNASATTPVTGPYDDFLTWTVDGSAYYKGLSVYAAFIGQTIESAGGNKVGDLHNYSALVQGGYFVIPDKLQPFVRFEWIAIDDKVATDDLHILTAGATYFFRKNSLKFTTDVMWAMDPITKGNTLGFTGATGSTTSTGGFLADAPGQENQVVVRAQLQLLF